MVLALVTYLFMMAVFGGFVLLNDNDTVDWADIVFVLYIVVSAPFGIVY